MVMEAIQDVLTGASSRRLPHMEHHSPAENLGRRPSASYERQSKNDVDSCEHGICSPNIVEDHPAKLDLQKTSEGEEGRATD